MRGANVVFVLLSFLLALPGILVSAWKWQLLLVAQGIKMFSFLRLWSLYHVGIFFSNFLPTEMGGDLIRTYEVGRVSGKHAKALAAVVVERATGLVVLILFAIIGVALNWSLSRQLGLTYIGIGCFLFVAVGTYAILHEGFARWVLSRVQSDFFHKIVEKATAFYKALLLYKSSKLLLVRTMVLSFFKQAIGVLIVHALVVGLNLPCTFREEMLVVPAILLIGLLPISINSVGLREGAFVYLYTGLGVDAPAAFALGLLSRVGLLLPGLVGGVIYGTTTRPESFAYGRSGVDTE
jgi:hypothetical protein